MILEALLQGGWSNDEKEEQEWSEDKNDDDDEPNQNSLVQSILKGSDESGMVQSALNSQTVSI